MSARVSAPASALDPSHGDPPAPSSRPRLDPREAPFSLCPPLLLPDLEQRILRVLRDAGSPVKSVQLAKECQVPKKKLNQVLYRMEKESKVSLAGLAMWRLGEGGTGEVVPTEPAQLSQAARPQRDAAAVPEEPDPQLSEQQKAIYRFLEGAGPCKALIIARALGMKTAKEVNPHLYDMRKRHLLSLDEKSSLWSIYRPDCGRRSESPAIIYQQNPINMICQNGPNNYISIENSEDIQIGHGNVIVKPTASGENGSVAPLHLPPMAPADPPTQSSPAAAWAPQDIRLEKSVLRRVLLGHGNEMSLTSAPAEGPAACGPSGSPPVSAATVGSGASFKIPGSKPGQRVHISSCFLEDTAIGNGNRMTVVSGTAGPGGVAEPEDSRRGPEELDKGAGPLSEGAEPRREFPPDPASSLSTNVSKLISHLEAVTLESRDPHNAEDGGRVDRTPDVASQGEVEPRTDSQPLSERAGERQ
ncbi:Z-DNA-binding protein 1 isoform X2 [Lynx rufus]|uniref:Z-DNA-binding protein 1 isoform X2 n=1 Tax=Lynx rufus TaxID=61384 RepID=UPI001F12635E|nr:Z-DNA-binding protein 1 isoform X2 [Lynx rufus]